MTTYNGRNALIKIGTVTVAEMASWSLDLSNDEIDTSAFGSTWKKSDVGMRGWTLSVSGHYDPSNTTGQGLVEAAWAAGSLISTIRAHVNAASYWTPSVTADANAGGRVTSYALNQAHDAVAGISFTLSGSGPVTFI
jgi:hypothetical protein